MNKVLFLILGVLLLSGHTYAQENQHLLSLAEAIDLGKSNNLSLAQQAERINQARANLNIKKAGYFPTLTAGGLFNYLSDIPELNLPLGLGAGGPSEVKIYDLSMQIQQPLFTGFRVRNQVNAADQDFKYSESQLQEVQNQIIFQITQIYYAAQLNLLQQKVYNTSLQRSQNNLYLAKNLFNAGQLRAIDTLTVSNQLFHLETSLNKLRHDYAVFLTQLELILNTARVAGVQTFSTTDLLVNLEALSVYEEQALQNRPELQQVHYQIQSQNFLKKGIQSAYYPQLYASATFHYFYPDVEILKKQWTDLYLIGLNLKWELWNRGRVKNQSRQISYAINILTTEQEKQIKTIKKEVKQGYQILLSDRDQIQFAQKVLQQEKQRYQITRYQFEQGLATTLDLKDAEEEFTAAELQLHLNYIKWLHDKAYIYYVTGTIKQKFSS
jgi:outer membrane protein